MGIRLSDTSTVADLSQFSVDTQAVRSAFEDAEDHVVEMEFSFPLAENGPLA